MTASTSYNAQHGPEYAIRHNTFVEGVHIGSWGPNNDDFNAGTSFIQLRLIKHKHIVFILDPTQCTLQ